MREIYKVAYDEVEELVLADETERLRDRTSATARRGARHATGRRSRPPWSQLSPPEDLLVWFGSWPEGVADGAGHADVTAALEAALAGRPVDRPLLAPLFAALAAEVEELDVRRRSSPTPAAARGSTPTSRARCARTCWSSTSGGWDADAAASRDLLRRVARRRAGADDCSGVT